MSSPGAGKGKGPGTDARLSGGRLFLLGVGLAYVILFLITPERTLSALRSSGRILGMLGIPLGVVFVLMAALRLFLDTSRVVRYMGEDSGLKGILLPVAAGILSFGPIYAWYPLLKEIREQGRFHPRS